MTGHIDVYLDCVSYFSYLAMAYLLKNREKLLEHGVTVEFHPIFLGGVNVGSGNKPPWTLPAKSKYLGYDTKRARNYFGLPDVRIPKFFPILSLLPQRLLTHMHSHPSTYPRALYESVFLALFSALWLPPQSDLSDPAQLLAVLTTATATTTAAAAATAAAATAPQQPQPQPGPPPLLPLPAETARALLAAAALPEAKAALAETTRAVLEEQSAFGAPWFRVRNPRGEVEPFFGSDRFHYMWQFLGIPWQDIEILPAEKAKL